MGLFTDRFTVPAGTLQGSPVTRTVYAQTGFIEELQLSFSHAAAKVHVQIFQGSRQILPDNSDGDFRDDNRIMIFHPHKAIIDPPTLTIKSWNEDASDHSVGVALTIGG